MDYNVEGNNIVESGMRILMEHFDTLELESFIYNLRYDNFDYTEWRQTQDWYNRPLEEIGREAAAFAREFEKTHKMPPLYQP
jgi:hypothetical protein